MKMDIYLSKKRITLLQLKKLFNYLLDDKRQATFRYLIYDIMGFKAKDYSDLYATNLMNLKDNLYSLRDENKILKIKIKELKKQLKNRK